MLTNLVKLAAEKARDAAEEYFKLQNFEMAIKTLKAASDFNPDLPSLDSHFTAYRVHQLAALKSTWYEILAIADPGVDISVIKKQYKILALMLHPDKNTSVAAEGAFKIIQSAMEVLMNPEKREAYNYRFCFKKSEAGSRSRPNYSSGASSFGFRKTDPPPKPEPNTSSNFRNRDSRRTSYSSSSQGCCARVEVSGRDGSRKIIISTNGRDEDVINLDANDTRGFQFFCSFFFGNHAPTVINCS